MDHLTVARIDPEPRSISTPTTTAPSPTARRLAVASISPNTRESYSRALRQFDTWRGRRPPDDSTLAAYLAVVYDSGRSPSVAARRGRLDAVIAWLLFMAGLRRSEVAALRWSDVTDADAPTSGVLVRVRTSKTNPTGETTDQHVS